MSNFNTLDKLNEPRRVQAQKEAEDCEKTTINNYISAFTRTLPKIMKSQIGGKNGYNFELPFHKIFRCNPDLVNSEEFMKQLGNVATETLSSANAYISVDAPVVYIKSPLLARLQSGIYIGPKIINLNIRIIDRKYLNSSGYDDFGN